MMPDVFDYSTKYEIHFFQALFYPCILLFTRQYHLLIAQMEESVESHDFSVRSWILSFKPLVYVCIVSLAVIFSIFIPLSFYAALIVVVWLTYADKLYLSRLIHDFPNFAVTVAYIVNIQNTPVSILSAVFSGIMLFYYLGSMFYWLLVEWLYPPKEQNDIRICISSDPPYGLLSCQKCIWLSIAQPLLIVLFLPFWIPLFAFHCVWYYVPPSDSSSNISGPSDHVLGDSDMKNYSDVNNISIQPNIIVSVPIKPPKPPRIPTTVLPVVPMTGGVDSTVAIN
jgi:uncharacterized membrane protein (GlpM family)